MNSSIFLHKSFTRNSAHNGSFVSKASSVCVCSEQNQYMIWLTWTLVAVYICPSYSIVQLLWHSGQEVRSMMFHWIAVLPTSLCRCRIGLDKLALLMIWVNCAYCGFCIYKGRRKCVYICVCASTSPQLVGFTCSRFLPYRKGFVSKKEYIFD